jgi:hypothetical protein
MNNGTNNYNETKLPIAPSEQIVSRTLQSRYRSFSNVVWRPGKPVLDSEWNLINDISLDWLTSYVQSRVCSGWLTLGKNKYTTNSGISNTIRFYSQENSNPLNVPNAIVNGWPILVAGTDYSDTSVNSIELPPAGATARWDFVFLEVWRAQVRSRDINNVAIAQNKPDATHIYKFGNVGFGTTASNNLDDDIVDTAIKPPTGIETSQRVQVQYKIRVVSDISNANTEVVGFEDLKAQGQGGSINPQISGYDFVNMKDELDDASLWRAGAGDNASIVALSSVDGYSYAIPMFKIYRRSTAAYDDTGTTQNFAYLNQQGNHAKLSDLDPVSDRPDGKFNDGIDASDIIDVRMKTVINNLDFSMIIEKNLDKLLRGTLKSAQVKNLNYDSISDADVNGYTDIFEGMGCNGKRNCWSDAVTDQSDIFSSVLTTDTDTTRDVYRSSGSGIWATGSIITIQSILKLPTGTVIKATPRIYLDYPNRPDISSLGTWTGLGTSTVNFTFGSSVNIPGVTPTTPVGSNKVLVYYDVTYPVGQGLSNVPDSVSSVKRINYANYTAFGSSNGTVIRGEQFDFGFGVTSINYQDFINHSINNILQTTVFSEIESVFQRKQIKFTPLIQSTSSRDGTTRVLSTKTVKTGVLYSPVNLQHVKGVYTAVTGGTEVATQIATGWLINSVNVSANELVINQQQSSSNKIFVCSLSSILYDPTGVFGTGTVELLTTYGPVYTHSYVTGGEYGTKIKLVNKTTGQTYSIHSGALASHFKWTGRYIKIREGSGYGYDINQQVIDIGSTSYEGSELWLDVDYYGAPHKGADLRVIYSSTPYQGASVGGQVLELISKREKGLYFNNGTAGSISLIGTSSNVSYTPVSPKLPGSKLDYLRDGSVITITGPGTQRTSTDFWASAAYELYASGSLWASQYTMPSTPSLTLRGFTSFPLLQVEFELPTLDRTNAEFVLVLLVKNVSTNELMLYVQTGNKGVQTFSGGSTNFNIDIFHLDERIVLK